MCGLLGSSGKSQARYLTALGCLSERRGSDSAGVAWQVGEQLRVHKVAQNPLVAYPVTLAPTMRHAARYAAPFIGHTRAATTGGVTHRNAHPFMDKNQKIAWAHNGIISNYADFGEFEVDSECLIQGIEKRDFRAFYGPIALLWIEDGLLHAFRRRNPLYRGLLDGAVYLASEEDMLKSIGCLKIKELSEGHVYVWEGDRITESRGVPYKPDYTSRTTHCRSTATVYPARQRGRYWNSATQSFQEHPRENDAIDDELDLGTDFSLCVGCKATVSAIGSKWCQGCMQDNWNRLSK